ncbi:MAG TPA: patatin-like phospholipase family protein [Gemmatimonadaceae bacterium]|nr:patatin-like phospholipase family protein [Gemmatimonadaceae bacterium]
MTTRPIDPRELVPEARDVGGELALVLTGGGARGAYQVGVLRHLARRFPGLRFPILTGVSAGAMNAAFLAQHEGTLAEATEALAAIWCRLEPSEVFRVGAWSLAGSVLGWGSRLVSGGLGGEARTRGLVDTSPLRDLLVRTLKPVNGELPGIERNIAAGRLRAVALSTTNYATGNSVVWVQGREIVTWERPKRRSVHTRIGVEHVMASAALPLFFPAVQLGRDWYGDGGMRQAAPLSPALHLGASKLLAIGTRYQKSTEEASQPATLGYPPPAQVLGVLYNSIFLDLIDQDVLRLDRLNRVLEKLPPDRREGLRVVDIHVMRPSLDLGTIAAKFEPRLPKSFRFLTRGLGTRKTKSPDLLSLLMFQGDYLRRLVDLGEADAAAQEDRLVEFLGVGIESARTVNP